MRKFITYLLAFMAISILQAQNQKGAWTTTFSADDGRMIEHVLILTENHFSEAIFEKENGKFIRTKGGSYSTSDDSLTFLFEFDSNAPEVIGESKIEAFKIRNGALELGNSNWTRIDDGSPGDLNGAWLISGRKRDGEIVKRDTSGPRKTMKILSGTRFQWIAYNTETKQFMGTGGGTYTTIDGKYTENIGFFSRDDSRVGASLQFNYEVKDGDWHHSGSSSKGKPIYEVWSQRAEK
ncbi:membrane or secreted protein [Muricauda ruestringensis]|uniref:membrane or secreted protein n=1 Tax=Flagellimonas ruestringensis TaxID=111501 RepID=UPI001CD6F254|nr:membrane or secreted protein [Allomuricauda ruestringensis]MCA0958851.1 membrane or secreted protein [Allomuricauda ruestringensis]